jgi:hypothetical protein
MGYVRPAGVFPYESFPIATFDVQCIRPLAWSIEVGALRCIPQGEEIPTPVQMAEVTLGVVMDARALYKAVKCCGYEVGIERYQPVGPEGGCVGGFWVAYLALD